MIAILAALLLVFKSAQSRRLAFFAPVDSGARASKLALPWALMRTQYPLSPLIVLVNGPDEKNAVVIGKLCSAIGHCTFQHFVKEDVFSRVQGDQYVHVNGMEGMRQLFAMYREASVRQKVDFVMLLQPDCLVRGRIPTDVLDNFENSDACVGAHHQPVNVMEPYLVDIMRKFNAKAPQPAHYSFTCGSLWKPACAPDVFSDQMAQRLAGTKCKYDDACIGCAIAIANHTVLESNHIADWRRGEHDNMTPILHADKRHYAREWMRLPVGVCPLYDRLREMFN